MTDKQGTATIGPFKLDLRRLTLDELRELWAAMAAEIKWRDAERRAIAERQ
jgi:hypothetical protein